MACAVLHKLYMKVVLQAVLGESSGLASFRMQNGKLPDDGAQRPSRRPSSCGTAVYDPDIDHCDA